MKITNKTVGRTILIIFILVLIIFILVVSTSLIIEQINHGCEFLDPDCGWSPIRLIASIVLVFSLMMFMSMLLDDDIYFEYEIKLPGSNRKTLNKLYSKMGEAAMRGDEAEEKRIWDVIQKMENR